MRFIGHQDRHIGRRSKLIVHSVNDSLRHVRLFLCNDLSAPPLHFLLCPVQLLLVDINHTAVPIVLSEDREESEEFLKEREPEWSRIETKPIGFPEVEESTKGILRRILTVLDRPHGEMVLLRYVEEEEEAMIGSTDFVPILPRFPR